MLRAEEIEALRDAATDLLRPVIEYLLRDIAERIAKAGQLTATVQYETWKLQQLGVSQRDLRNYLKKALKVSNAKLKQLLTQSAEVGYNYDLSSLPTVRAIPFEENEAVQQIVRAAIAQTQGTLENLTQTLGMVDPYGNVNPLRDTYRKCMDYAFEQVSSGAVDYNTAIREATRNLAVKGVEFIDYESGVTTSLEAAVRRNIMGALGLMQEQISQYNHDQYGATGWEIDAHSNSAPDHEPIQGKQYTDAEYETLNNSLVRRIGTLNCGHSAHPIVYGASVPQYTPEELEEMRQKNETGISFRGKHYTGYEATQRQRRLERAIRAQKRKILIDKATGDAEKLETDQIKLQLLQQDYKAFSKAAGLRTQHERLEKVGFAWKEATEAKNTYQSIAKQANSMYDTGSEAGNIAAWQRDKPIRAAIGSDQYPLTILQGKQDKHIQGTRAYVQYQENLKKKGEYGPSYLTVDRDALKTLVDQYHGKGILLRDKAGNWRKIERITVHPDPVGVSVNNLTGAEAITTTFTIRYSKDGVHIVPDYPSRKGDKAKK